MANQFREKHTKYTNPTNQTRELSAVGKYRLTKMKQRQMMRYFSLQHPENRSRSVGSCSSSSASSSVCDSQERLSLDQAELADDTFLNEQESSKQSTDRRATFLAEGKALLKSRRKDLNRLKSDSDVITHRRRRIVCEDMVRSKTYIMTSDSQKVPVEEYHDMNMKQEQRCIMQHPTKKMLRTRSESAIELSSARNRHGVVCSNEDLKKILTEARKIGSVRRRRTNSGHLAVTPESIDEIDGHVRSKSVSMISSLKGRRSPDIIHEYHQSCRSSPTTFESFNSPYSSISRANSANEIRSIQEIDEDVPSCSRDCVDNNDNKVVVESDANVASELADTLSAFSIGIDSAIDPEAIGKAIERRLTVGSKQGNKLLKRGSNQTNINFQKNQLSNRSKDTNTQGSDKGFANRITSLTSKFKRSKSTTDCVKL